MRYYFTNAQVEALRKMPIPFDFSGDLTENEELVLLDIVGDQLQSHGGAGGEINGFGEICEDIINDMVEQDAERGN